MRSLHAVTLASLALALGGCSLVVRDKVGPLEPDALPDMSFQLLGFDAHGGQLMELFLVSDAGLVQARAIFDPLPEPDVLVTLDNAVAANVRRVDFYSDLNRNRSLDAPVPDPIEAGRVLYPDHMWRRQLAEDGTGEFMHSTDFADIVGDNPAQLVGGPVQIVLSGAADFAGQPAQVWVTDSSDRDVGFYYLGAIAGDTIDLSIHGIVDPGSEYEVTLAVGSEPLLCVAATGTADGLLVEGPLSWFSPCDEQE